MVATAVSSDSAADDGVLASRAGPTLTWTGRLVAIGAVLAMLVVSGVPPLLPAVAVVLVVADTAVAVAWFRPGRLRAAAGDAAIAGDEVSISLQHRDIRSDVVFAIDRASDAAWVAAGVEGTTVVPATPPGRAVYVSVSVHGSLLGPLGLGAAVRRWHVPLARPLVVRPARRPTPFPTVAASSVLADGTTTQRGDEIAEQLREHRPGDSVRRIHWPASERNGELLVRSGDRPVEQLHLGVDLGPTAGDEAEHVASAAMDIGTRWLQAGNHLCLSVMVDRSADDVAAERTGPDRRPSPYRAVRSRRDDVVRPVGVAEVDITDVAHLGLVLAAAVPATLPADVDVDLRVDAASISS